MLDIRGCKDARGKHGYCQVRVSLKKRLDGGGYGGPDTPLPVWFLTSFATVNAKMTYAFDPIMKRRLGDMTDAVHLEICSHSISDGWGKKKFRTSSLGGVSPFSDLMARGNKE